MSTSSTNLSIDSPAVTVLLDRITQEIGDPRLSQLIHQKLVQVFEWAEASKNEAINKAERLETERASLSQKKHELEAEQLALQEQQEALHAAAESLKALPSRVKDLSDAFDKLNTDLSEERQAASEAGSSTDRIEAQATKAATALDKLKKQVEALTGMPQGIATLTTTIGAIQTGQTGLVGQVTDVVNKVGDLTTTVVGIPTEAKIKELVEAGPTGLVAEVKSTSDVLKTLATKADLEDWSRARAEAQAKSNQEAISRCVKAALKDFQDSTVAEYTQKLGRYEAADEKKREAFDDLKNKAIALEDRYTARGQRLAALEKENSDLKSALQKRDQELAGSSSRIEELANNLTEAEAWITRRNTTIGETMERIGRRDKTIAEANEQIGLMDATISEVKAQIVRKDKTIQETHELMESYKEAIKTKDSQIEQMCARLEAAEARATPPMTQRLETHSSSLGMFENLSQVYLKLSNEFRGIPTSNESEGDTDLSEIAVKIAPKLLRPQAKPMIQEFLNSGAQGWHCLQRVVDRGSQAESVPEGTCALHGQKCVLVQVVASEEGRVLNFYDSE
ncbi:hypothetical protein MRS44_009755 [Fusarium solani]|uniref:uncharacterized protein n=1 Tax=Fusarium solani TaxID=169388 RepID=UPI0032C40BAA|nr:hypothetical protein MRS44_009755 [Fusarium solani]